jgi:hypothetical protein
VSEFPRSTPTQPTIIPTGFRDPVTFPGLDALAASVAGALGDRRLELVRGMAGYPGWDTFPIFTVHGVARGQPFHLDSDSYICAVAVQSTPAETLHAMIEAVQARGGPPKLAQSRRAAA